MGSQPRTPAGPQSSEICPRIPEYTQASQTPLRILKQSPEFWNSMVFQNLSSNSRIFSPRFRTHSRCQKIPSISGSQAPSPGSTPTLEYAPRESTPLHSYLPLELTLPGLVFCLTGRTVEPSGLVLEKSVRGRPVRLRR